jgi:hypothetical protein
VVLQHPERPHIESTLTPSPNISPLLTPGSPLTRFFTVTLPSFIVSNMNAIRAMTFERYTPVFYEDEEEDAEDFEGFEGATLLDNDNDDPEEDENGCYPLSRCPTRPPSSPCHNCIVLSAHLSELETATTDTLEVTKKSLEETQDKLKKTEAQSQSYQTQMEDYKTKMESYKTNNEDLVKEHVKLKKEKWELRRLVGDGTGTTRRKIEADGVAGQGFVGDGLGG